MLFENHMLDKNKTGVALGVLLGLFHAAWAFLVLVGWAQPLMDWIFGLHFIQPPYTITEFYWGTAIVLIVVTAVIGYIVGWVLAAIWNGLHRGRTV
jgi:hypothetical protein